MTKGKEALIKVDTLMEVLDLILKELENISEALWEIAKNTQRN